MRAILLAAGYGSRLMPLTKRIPKCLIDINGRPLLDYWLELLSAGGVTQVLVNLHYLPEMILSFVEKNRHPIDITLVHEENLLGTGGSVLKNRDFFGEEPFMIIHADNLSWFNIKSFVKKFTNREDGVEITMMTFETDNPSGSGIIQLNNLGIVESFWEKVTNPPGNLANGAVYIATQKVIDYMVELNKEVFDLSKDVIPQFVGRINTFHNDLYHRDIGTLESLDKARREYPLIVSRARRGISLINNNQI
jgi:mannose-1-phosphate guanylyltransferase